MKTLSRFLTLPLFLAAMAAPAQTVYRCGNSYSQQPCPGGMRVETDDRRTPEQRRAHEASVDHERRVGNRLEKNRLKEEADAARAAQQAEKAQQDLAAKEQKRQTKPPKKGNQDKLPAYRAPPKPSQR